MRTGLSLKDASRILRVNQHSVGRKMDAAIEAFRRELRQDPLTPWARVGVAARLKDPDSLGFPWGTLGRIAHHSWGDLVQMVTGIAIAAGDAVDLLDRITTGRRPRG
jgi:hypothetical protein